MPQLVTHNIFSDDVFNTLPNDLKNTFINEIDIYKMFAQSFDNFYYYTSLNIKKMKEVHKLAKKGHKKNAQKYFCTIVEEIKNNNYQNNEQALAYLYGSINHYILDSTCHPFIFYKTGVYDKKRKDRHKYIGLHGDMESNIEAFYYINKYKKMYYNANITKEFIPKIKFSKDLENIMNIAYYKTYDFKDMAKYYFKSYNLSRHLYRIFINDKYGIKKSIYKIIDKVAFFRENNYEYYTTYIKQPNIKYLNIDHKEWVYPSDKTIKMNDSFIDLYNKALKKTQELIILADKVINDKADIKDFENKIGNLSYVRGLDCDRSKPMEEFEF